MSARRGAKSVKRFGRSDGLDTALFKNDLFILDVSSVHQHDDRATTAGVSRQCFPGYL